MPAEAGAEAAPSQVGAKKKSELKPDDDSIKVPGKLFWVDEIVKNPPLPPIHKDLILMGAKEPAPGWAMKLEKGALVDKEIISLPDEFFLLGEPVGLSQATQPVLHEAILVSD